MNTHCTVATLPALVFTLRHEFEIESKLKELKNIVCKTDKSFQVMHIWISCTIKSMKWNLVKPFIVLLLTLGDVEQYNQATSQWQCGDSSSSSSGGYDLVIASCRRPPLFIVVVVVVICKTVHDKICTILSPQHTNNAIYFYLDKLWQIILIAFHENCATVFEWLFICLWMDWIGMAMEYIDIDALT